MRDLLGPGTTAGYCTNVHAGATLDEALANLDRHAPRVKALASPGAPLGVGLWLSARAAGELDARGGAPALAEWLDARGLLPYTVNAFPFGDFHRGVVKHRVYEPDWATDDRLRYSLRMAELLAGLLAPGEEGSVSTLPVGWGTLAAQPERVRGAAERLLRAAEALEALEERTGRLVHLDLEPEPGCFLQRADDVARFFGGHLLRGAGGERARRYLRVCHDVCHAAVMFEGQAEALDAYRAAGVAVGKVQLSSALRVPFGALAPDERVRAAHRLRAFGEARYLHQTTVRAEGAPDAFYEDLPAALEARGAGAAGSGGARALRGEWRVHFHVPLFVDRFGPLETTRDEVTECLAALREEDGVRHFEVETYAWDVLPGPLRGSGLAPGIARELAWLARHALQKEPA